MKRLKLSKRPLFILIICLILAAGGYSFWALKRTPKELLPSAAVNDVSVQVPPTKLSWPSGGQTAVGILGTGILDTHNTQTPAPTASTAKMITALLVLKAHPLALNQTGPEITMTAADVAIYNAYLAEQGSVVQVTAGEQLSEYQMLEAMLLPSANNIADTLATWAYGSLTAYSAAANTFLQDQGLDSTHIGSDASGFLPTSTSTASDLVKIGELLMKNPVLAQIVGEKTMTGIPLVTDNRNVNWLLGTDNIIGVKTGNTDQAGGVFVGAATANIDNKTVTVITAQMGSPTLQAALNSSLPLIESAQANFTTLTLAQAGATVGTYYVPWSHSFVSAVTDQALTAPVWNGSTLGVNSVNLNPLSYKVQSGQTVGSVSNKTSGLVGDQSVNVSLASSIPQPSIWWRLTHP
jgi:serine-type D-Ala-D-Ala carboxypeptidase (penicillin-binding protein 5/6)